MVDRAAVVLKYKEPGVAWVNEVDPSPGPRPLNLEDMNHEWTVNLISDEDAEDDRTFAAWLDLNYLSLFENELSGWYGDESLWPANLTRDLFDSWFAVELHSVLIDTVGTDICDDEI